MLWRTHIRIVREVLNSIGISPSSPEASRMRDGVIIPDKWKDFPHHHGKGKRTTEEIDILMNEENRLKQLRAEMKLSIKTENEQLKTIFTLNFFEKLAFLKKKQVSRNETLAKMARDLLEKKRRILFPLEKTTKSLEMGDLQ